MNSLERVLRSMRARGKKPILDLDLNAVPICDSIGQEGSSNQTRSLDGQAVQEGNATLPAPIDLEALDDDDDDVIISSPRAFAQAKNNPRRNRGRTMVVDVDSEDSSSRAKRRRVPANQTIINCDLYINLEGINNSMRGSGGESVRLPSSAPPPPPIEPTFSCPVCMGPLVEEMSTKCGHIFCKACIKAAIAAQSKCPTCRKKITMKELIRIYLPATTLS